MKKKGKQWLAGLMAAALLMSSQGLASLPMGQAGIRVVQAETEDAVLKHREGQASFTEEETIGKNREQSQILEPGEEVPGNLPAEETEEEKEETSQAAETDGRAEEGNLSTEGTEGESETAPKAPETGGGEEVQHPAEETPAESETMSQGLETDDGEEELPVKETPAGSETASQGLETDGGEGEHPAVETASPWEENGVESEVFTEGTMEEGWETVASDEEMTEFMDADPSGSGFFPVFSETDESEGETEPETLSEEAESGTELTIGGMERDILEYEVYLDGIAVRSFRAAESYKVVSGGVLYYLTKDSIVDGSGKVLFNPATRPRYMLLNGSTTWRDGLKKRACYCMASTLEDPAGEVNVSTGKKITKAHKYILYNGVRQVGHSAYNTRYRTGDSMRDYFITAMAIHLTNMDAGNETKVSQSTIKAKVKESNIPNAMETWNLIVKLYNDAKNCSDELFNTGGDIAAPTYKLEEGSPSTLPSTSWKEDGNHYRTSSFQVACSCPSALTDNALMVVNKADGKGVSGVKAVYTNDNQDANFYVQATKEAYEKIKAEQIILKVTSSAVAHAQTGKVFSPVDSVHKQPVVMMDFGSSKRTKTITGYVEPPKEDPKGKVIVHKKSIQEQKLLSGAVFKLDKRVNGSYTEIGTLAEQGNSGTYQMENLEAGSYQVRETKAPVGYHLSSPPWKETFELAAGQTVTLTCENEKDYTVIQVIKKDSDTEGLLSGAEYGIYSDKACQHLLDKAGPTNQNGTALSGKLYQGLDIYYVKETKAPADHLLNQAVYEVKPETNDTVTVLVKNEPVKARVKTSKLALHTTGATLKDGRYEGTKIPGWYMFGKEFSYKIIVTNSGNVTAKNLAVTEEMSKELKEAVVSGSEHFSIPEGIRTNSGAAVTVKQEGMKVTIDKLAPGDGVAFDFVVKVKEIETALNILEGIDNVVRVTGEYENDLGGTVENKKIPQDEDDWDNDKINLIKPKVSISKLADKTTGVVLKDGRYEGTKSSGWYAPEAVVTYKVIVRNYGNVDLRELRVTESMSEELKAAIQKGSGKFLVPEGLMTDQGNPVDIKVNSGTELTIQKLLKGDSVTFSYQVTLKKVPEKGCEGLDNVIEVNGRYETPKGDVGEIPEDEDDYDNDKINVIRSKISVSKLAGRTTGASLKEGRYEGTKIPGWYDFGETVRYRLIVRNYGNVPVKDFVVTEHPSKELRNAMEGSGRFVIPQGVKTEEGRKVSLKAEGDKLIIDRLEIGDSVAFDFEITLKKKEIPKLEMLDNVAMVTGIYETPKKDTGRVEKDEDDQDNDKINIANPLASVAKLADKTTGVVLKNGRYEGEKVSGWYDFGSEVSYHILIQNNGNVPLYQVHLEETFSQELSKAVGEVLGYVQDLDKLTSSQGKKLKTVKDKEGFGFTIEELEKGDSVSVDLRISLKEKEIPTLEGLENKVAVTGKYQLTGEEKKDFPKDGDDDDWDKINVADPKLSIVKLADRTTGVTLENGRMEGEKKAGIYYGGETVTYEIQVNNQGNVPARDVMVTEVPSKELLDAAEATGGFDLSGEMKTIGGKEAEISLDKENRLVVKRLEAQDGIVLPYTLTLKKSGLQKRELLNNQVSVSGDYQPEGEDPKKIPEDEDDRDEDDVTVNGSCLEIHKVAAGSGEKLSGAKFTIFDESGQEVETLVTDKDGYAKSGELFEKRYSVKEVKAPKGYLLDEEEYEFSIEKGEQIVTFTFENQPLEEKEETEKPIQTSDSPKAEEEAAPVRTGDSSNGVLWIALSVFWGTAAVLAARLRIRRKKKDRNR